MSALFLPFFDDRSDGPSITLIRGTIDERLNTGRTRTLQRDADEAPKHKDIAAGTYVSLGHLYLSNKEAGRYSAGEARSLCQRDQKGPRYRRGRRVPVGS
jgi:hypothetical protein